MFLIRSNHHSHHSVSTTATTTSSCESNSFSSHSSFRRQPLFRIHHHKKNNRTNTTKTSTKNTNQQQQKDIKDDKDHAILIPNNNNTNNYNNNVILDNLYTNVIKSIGVGSYADVRLVQSKTTFQMLAIKTFRKRTKNNNITERKFMKQITSEYCIASSLNHPNIIKTFDLGKDLTLNRYFIVMEYCPDGDLCTAISHGLLRSMDELHCYFKQLLQGLVYLHDTMGIAHRDIKPENLLLSGHLLKITDFGVADVMRDAWQTKKRKSHDLCGTTSYVAPELYTHDAYRGDKADMWSVGIVYYVMRRGEMLFASTKLCDPFYRTYLRCHSDQEYALFNNEKLFHADVRAMLYRLLDPTPSRRYSAQQLLKLPWITKLPVCCQKSKYHDHVNGSSMTRSHKKAIRRIALSTSHQKQVVNPIVQQQQRPHPNHRYLIKK
ncbi:kinase-like domain-containing protein [Circinella umbellata]|nr:kinase-like domain-containing protein [Circinella umbellata]